MPGRLDFFFFYGSTYTYLTVMRIENVAADAGVEVRWRPFNVRGIMLEQNNIPFRDKPVKVSYMWRDVERRANRYGNPFNGIPTYPVDPESLANRGGVLAAIEGWCPEYTKATYRAWFLEDKPPEIPNTSTRSSHHRIRTGDRPSVERVCRPAAQRRQGEDGAIVGTVRLESRFWNIAVAAVSILLLVMLVGYFFAENFVYRPWPFTLPSPILFLDCVEMNEAGV